MDRSLMPLDNHGLRLQLRCGKTPILFFFLFYYGSNSLKPYVRVRNLT